MAKPNGSARSGVGAADGGADRRDRRGIFYAGYRGRGSTASRKSGNSHTESAPRLDGVGVDRGSDLGAEPTARLSGSERLFQYLAI
jgi:hypothetical protein